MDCPIERIASSAHATLGEQGAFPAAHRPRLSPHQRSSFLGVIISFSLLVLLGLVEPLQLAHASTTNDTRTRTGSLDVAPAAHTVPLLHVLDKSALYAQVLASTKWYFPGATPMLYLPGTITVNATSPLGATVFYTVSASDPDNPSSLPTITCTPFSGSIFPIGTTTVLCTASDMAGNTTSGSFLVIVLGRTPPVLYLPGTITVDATSPQGAVVTFIINASDPDNPASQPTVTCIPPSGSTFPIGTTTVLCTASNPAGSSTSGSFQVIVVNNTAPVLHLPAIITVKATSRLGATVTYTVSATNPNDPASRPIITCIPPSGSIFPIGTTTVLCTARDLAGNTTSGTFLVIVKGPAARLSAFRNIAEAFIQSDQIGVYLFVP